MSSLSMNQLPYLRGLRGLGQSSFGIDVEGITKRGHARLAAEQSAHYPEATTWVKPDTTTSNPGTATPGTSSPGTTTSNPGTTTSSSGTTTSSPGKSEVVESKSGTTKESAPEKGSGSAKAEVGKANSLAVDRSITNIRFGAWRKRSQRVSPLGVSWQFGLQPRGPRPLSKQPLSMGWAMVAFGVLFGGAALYVALKD